MVKAIKYSQGLWLQIYCTVCNYKGYLIPNCYLSWLKGFCLVSIGRFETNSTCTHQVSYKGRSDSFHQKTILISPLTCHGAPYICMSSSYSLIKPCIQHLYRMYKVCSKSEWMSWMLQLLVFKSHAWYTFYIEVPVIKKKIKKNPIFKTNKQDILMKV